MVHVIELLVSIKQAFTPVIRMRFVFFCAETGKLVSLKTQHTQSVLTLKMSIKQTFTLVVHGS